MLLYHRFLCVLAVVALAVGLCPARADDAEMVKEKLFQAKKAYDAETQKFRKAVGDLLDKREAKARKDGNKKLVDQIKAEQKAFEKRGELPAVLPVALRQQIGAARTKLDKAYTAAVKDFLKLKEDAAAGETEKEQQKVVIEAGFLFGKRTHLTTLKPFNVKTEKDGFEHDITVTVQKEVFLHSIRPDPVSEGNSQVSYALAGKWSALRARVGVPKFEDTVKAPVSELTFEILGDGKSLWKSKPTNKLDEFQTCEVPLTKVNVLTFQVHCPKSGEWARACWLEPLLAE